MNRNRVTVRYAKALLEMAQEQNLLPQIDKDLALLDKVLKQSRGFRQFVTLPRIASDKKYKYVASIFESNFHKLTVKFIRLVFDNGREVFLPDIVRNYIQLSDVLQNNINATLVFANEVSPSVVVSLTRAFEIELGKNIRVVSRVDPSIIGGFIVTLDGMRYDASLASALKLVSNQLQISKL